MGEKPYRVNLKLDPALDADLIAWLESLPHGTRSRSIRERLRQSAPGEAADLEGIRRLLAEELARALAGRQAEAAADGRADPGDEVDMEARFGGRLNRMLGGLGRSDEDGQE